MYFIYSVSCADTNSLLFSPYISRINIHITTSNLLNTSNSQNKGEGTITNSLNITITQFLFKIIGANAEKTLRNSKINRNIIFSTSSLANG